MPDDGEPGTRDVHQTVLGGEHVLIRRARPEDVALYQDFLAGVSADEASAPLQAQVRAMARRST